MDITQYGVGALVIIGFVNIYKFATEQQWVAFGSAIVALLAGVIFGSLNMFGLQGVEMGIQVALASSGLYKLTQKVGGQQ